jgi:fucose permease
MKVKEKDVEGSEPASIKSCFGLLKNPYVLLMVLGIFLYVGTEISMRSHLPIFFKEQFGINIKKEGLIGVLFFDIALLAGRFLGGVILNWIKPRIFFIISAFLSIIGLLGIFLSSNSMGIGSSTAGFASALVIGLGFANLFPLIFSITVDSMPERTNELSGLMVTAIVGGAFIPPLMGFVQDISTVLIGFVVPLAILVYIIMISLFNKKKQIA